MYVNVLLLHSFGHNYKYMFDVSLRLIKINLYLHL